MKHEYLNTGSLTYVDVSLFPVRPATIAVSGPQFPVLEGETIIVTCLADVAKPLPEIKWFQRGNNIHVVYNLNSIFNIESSIEQ